MKVDLVSSYPIMSKVNKHVGFDCMSVSLENDILDINISLEGVNHEYKFVTPGFIDISTLATLFMQVLTDVEVNTYNG